MLTTHRNRPNTNPVILLAQIVLKLQKWKVTFGCHVCIHRCVYQRIELDVVVLVDDWQMYGDVVRLFGNFCCSI